MRACIVISACDKGKRTEQALHLFEAMKQQFMVPNVITCSALISPWEKSE